MKAKADLVIYCHVLEHLPDPVKELRGVRKVLKEGGLLYIEVPGLRNVRKSYYYNQDLLRYLQGAHNYHFTLKSLRNCAEKAGFEFIKGDNVVRSLFKIGKPAKKYRKLYFITMKYFSFLIIIITFGNPWST